MTWTAWILASSVLLAMYDLAKKASVAGNAVLPTLLCSTLFGCAAFAAGLALGGRFPSLAALTLPVVAAALAKSAIVATSWVFTFTALRTLPISLATPIRASAPAMVFVMALFAYGETPNWTQGLGMLLSFAGYFAFSWAGRHEGIDFFRNRAVWCAIGGAVFSAFSSMWDKFVFQVMGAPVDAVQFVFQIGLVFVYAALLAGKTALTRRVARMLAPPTGFASRNLPSDSLRSSTAHPNAPHGGLMANRPTGFEWRWTIPIVGILLAGADWMYFNGLSIPGVAISVASLLRRFSVVITFVLGARFFHETNLWRKAIALSAVLVGSILLCI